MAYDLTASAGYTPAFTTGKFGQALTNSTTGVQAYTVTGNFGITSGAWTLEAWLKTTSTAVEVAFGNSADLAWFGSNAGKATAVATDGGSLASTVSINDGAWHHVAVAADGSTQRMFVDGALQTSRASTKFLWSTTASIVSGVAWMAGNTSFGWIGQLDEMRISNIARYTAAFTAPAAAFSYDTNTVALWHLDGNGTNDNTVAATGHVKAWTGAAFAPKPVKVWTGSAWVVKPVKRWTGTAWVPTSY